MAETRTRYFHNYLPLLKAMILMPSTKEGLGEFMDIIEVVKEADK